MLEFEFLKTVDETRQIFKEHPLPAIIMDLQLQVYWGNTPAKRLYPLFLTQEGISVVLEQVDREQVLKDLREKGNCTVTDIIPLSGVRLSMSPILRQGEMLGIVGLVLEPEAMADPHGVQRTTKTASAVSTGIRQAVQEVFSIMDTAAHKADLMQAGWVKPNFEQISYLGYRVLRMADNLSVYSSFLNGSAYLEQEAWDIFDLLEELCGAAGILTQASGVPVELKLSEEDRAFVLLDRSYFELALFNILHNSFYYTKEGNQVTVEVQKSGADITVFIADRGLGIPEHVLPQVVRPYFSYDHSGSHCTTGLGLTLAKIIMEAHSGTLAIDSHEGIGTTVTLQLRENTFSSRIPLAQGSSGQELSDRFSRVYTSLYDIYTSPYR